MIEEICPCKIGERNENVTINSIHILTDDGKVDGSSVLIIFVSDISVLNKSALTLLEINVQSEEVVFRIYWLFFFLFLMRFSR
jgi:hypothetical protein